MAAREEVDGVPPEETMERERRQRTLTEAAQEIYEEKRYRLSETSERAWYEVEEIINNILKSETESPSGEICRTFEADLTGCFHDYTAKNDTYQNFLKQTHTSESLEELEVNTNYYNRRKKLVTIKIRYLRAIRLDTLESETVCSLEKMSVKSRESVIQKANLEYTRKKSEIMQEKARVKEELEITKARSERKQAELNGALEFLKQENETKKAEICSQMGDDEDDRDSVVDRVELTRQYVKGTSHSNLDPRVQAFEPHTHHEQPAGNDIVTALSQFLLKKDLQLSRITQFDDRIETYASWKSSFKSVSENLNLTPAEEVDLLIKFLGPHSCKSAMAIKAANTDDLWNAREQIWLRIEERYGRPEMMEASIKKKLDQFPKIDYKNMGKLYDLLDILCEIESLKRNPIYASLLAYFDSSSGVNIVIKKFPFGLQEKWTSRAARYKQDHCVPYPPFTFFLKFVRELSTTKNDPAFRYDNNPVKEHRLFIRKQEVCESTRCPIHNAHHSLKTCKDFNSRSLDEKRKYLREKKLCFRCLDSNKHVARECKVDVKCQQCGRGHATTMHVDKVLPAMDHGGERSHMNSKCTTLCGDKYVGRSCSKTVLVDVYPENNVEKGVRVYAVIDDQSNGTLASSDLFDSFNISGDPVSYTLSSCSGRTTKYGRQMNNLCVRSVDGSTHLQLPLVTECDAIPNERSEIPTPEVAKAYGHLKSITNEIPKLENSDIQLLIGRDVPEVHHVLEQITGERGAPFAQRLPLGWVIIGEVCTGRLHLPNVVSVKKTCVLPNGQSSCMEPCPYTLKLKECHESECDSSASENQLFVRTSEDNQVSSSIEDKQFMRLMEEEMKLDNQGFWTAPLPFKTDRPKLPNNKQQAWRRAKNLDGSLKRDPIKREHFVTFMRQILESGAAEVAPALERDSECWYLPLFGVYHPKKPGKLRGVFDSSAVLQGLSLNSVLMSGPDMTTSLLGVLLRFRKDEVAISADVEQMFYRFRVAQEHRDFLRFFWYKENDPDKDLIEFRMCVHVFGNTASPAVATYGLRRAVQTAGEEVQEFVQRNFYVDDALASRPTAHEAIELLKKTRVTLQEVGHIRLHKIASNNLEVLGAFPHEDLGGDLKSLDLGTDMLPTQRSLGLDWDLKKDHFTFRVQLGEKPITKRGLLSMINSIYDPLGFIAPITISGKILLREATSQGVDWDAPLPIDCVSKWRNWRESVEMLQAINIPRMYTDLSFTYSKTVAVSIYSDASEKAIAAVSYLHLTDSEGSVHSGFLLGKAKLAPLKGHSIPRLELCAAVLATEIAETVTMQLDIPLDAITFYTDSKVVLGYLCNKTRRFFTYVSNRVERILNITEAHQWRYVSTESNPADIATRCSSVSLDRVWLEGPVSRQQRISPDYRDAKDRYDLIDPDRDGEIRPEIRVKKTNLESDLVPRFAKFSTWLSLIRAFTVLKRACVPRDKRRPDVTLLKETENFIIEAVQKSQFYDEIKALTTKKALPASSTILPLNVFIDEDGIIRVGGRIRKAEVSDNFKHPVIIPKKSHVALLLVRHLHEKVHHQGRLITEAALRSAGFWIVGAKRLVSSVIHGCVTCRRLRGKLQNQQMADVPVDRITPTPPFTSVGVDAFGPWEVSTRKTRGGAANSKRWGIIFTCLSSRAIHIELVEEMSSACFILALRRFQAIRGPVKEFRSDRGTNFVGALDDIKAKGICVEDGPVKKHLSDSRILWKFNPPHASHMGGVWERLIGLARRILDAMLLKSHGQNLTHAILCTFMFEVCAIINSRPIAPMSTDPECPNMLSPNVLLTQKMEPLPGLDTTVSIRDMYKSQWKHVEVLTNSFWKQWKHGYLQTLQSRQKWFQGTANLKVGDIVLVKDSNEHRNHWSVARIVNTFPSESDTRVRTVEIRVAKDGKCVNYVRPVTELVLLVE